MKKKLSTLLLLALFCLLQFSCDKTNTAIENPHGYVKLEVGQFRIYDVLEENFFAGVSQPNVTTYQEKDEVVSYDGNNRFTISRFTRENVNTAWKKTKQYSMQILPDRLTKTIDNKVYVQMVFPINLSTGWNGNIYNNLPKIQYQYAELGVDSKINDHTYGNTLKVIADNDYNYPNLLTLENSIWQYSYGIGLIYEQENLLEYCQETAECIGEGIIESGLRRTKKLVESNPI